MIAAVEKVDVAEGAEVVTVVEIAESTDVAKEVTGTRRAEWVLEASTQSSVVDLDVVVGEAAKLHRLRLRKPQIVSGPTFLLATNKLLVTGKIPMRRMLLLSWVLELVRVGGKVSGLLTNCLPSRTVEIYDVMCAMHSRGLGYMPLCK